jgi:hypothetical protein
MPAGSPSVVRRASSALRHAVLLSLIGTLLATVALGFGAGRAVATPETICNGGLASGIMVGGEPHDFLIDVPAGATLTVEGSAYFGGPGLGGENLDFTPNSGLAHQGDLVPSGPITWTTSHTWTAGGANIYPLTMSISQTYGSNVPFGFTFRVSQTHGCAARTGAIRGGHNESEPYGQPCNCAKPVSTDSGNFYHSFSDFAPGGRGPGLGPRAHLQQRRVLY